jgi:RNA polymerase sigma-70 factor (ECF subfamily)
MGQSLSGWEAGHFRKANSQSGDNEMARLIEPEIPRLRRLARCLARDPVLADDLVQECLFRAIKRFNTWQPGTNLRAWLMTILRNVFFTELRRTRRFRQGVEFDEINPAVPHAGLLDRPLDLAAVQRAFDSLSDEHRDILFLVAVEELRYEEAASVLGVPLGTVRSRLFRARAAMRELLPDFQPMPEAGRSRFRNDPAQGGRYLSAERVGPERLSDAATDTSAQPAAWRHSAWPLPHPNG